MFNKTINATIFLSSQAVYNSLDIDFGDENNLTINIDDHSQRLKSYFGIDFNLNETNLAQMDSGLYVSSNAESKIDSNLVGFEMNVAVAGNLFIHIMSTNEQICKTFQSCANYFSEYQTFTGFQTVWSKVLSVTKGHNKIYLDKKIKITKNSVFYLDMYSYSARLFIEKNSATLYTDFKLSGTNLERFDNFANWRIQLNALIEEKYYDYTFNIVYQYDFVNLYNLTLNFSNEKLNFIYKTKYQILNSN